MVNCLVVHDKSMTTFLLAAKIFPPKEFHIPLPYQLDHLPCRHVVWSAQRLPTQQDEDHPCSKTMCYIAASVTRKMGA